MGVVPHRLAPAPGLLRRGGAAGRAPEPLLAQDLRKRWEFGPLQAETLAAELLRFWEGAGLLDVYRLAGQEWLAFRHLTFQEYGAARALAELSAFDRWTGLRPHLHDPKWREVVLLTAGLVPDPNEFLLAILEAGSNLNEYLHRDELLAASCLDQVDQIGKQVEGRILDSLRRLIRSPIQGLAKDAWNALSRLGSTPLASRAVDIVLNEIGYDTWWARFAGRFLQLSVWGVRLDRIIIYLMRQWSGRDEYWNDRHGTWWGIRTSLAVSSLGQLGWVSPRVISSLLWALADHNPNVQAAAAKSLGQLGQSTPEIVTALRQHLSDYYGFVGREAALSLTRLGYRDSEVTDVLGTWGIEERWKTRVTKMGRVRSAIMTVAANYPDAEIGKYAHMRSDELHRASSQVADACVQDLQHREPHVCESAAYILGELGDTRPHIVKALVSVLGDRRRGLREDLKAHRWLDALLWLLLVEGTDRLWVGVRAEAARSLGKLGDTSPEVIDVLVKAFHDVQEVRNAAYYALLRLARTD